jgi:sec-independent protein translocase protein TatA
MFGIGPPELLLIAGIALLLFGSRVPDVMRNLGKGISEFKRGLSSVQDEIRRVDDATGSS